jgi:hypothetical protein
MHSYVQTYVYACVCVYIYIYIYIYTHTHTSFSHTIPRPTYIYIHAYIQNSHTYTKTRICELLPSAFVTTFCMRTRYQDSYTYQNTHTHTHRQGFVNCCRQLSSLLFACAHDTKNHKDDKTEKHTPTQTKNNKRMC